MRVDHRGEYRLPRRLELVAAVGRFIVWTGALYVLMMTILMFLAASSHG